jgi:hypothetical protein
LKEDPNVGIASEDAGPAKPKTEEFSKAAEVQAATTQEMPVHVEGGGAAMAADDNELEVTDEVMNAIEEKGKDS